MSYLLFLSFFLQAHPFCKIQEKLESPNRQKVERQEIRQWRSEFESFESSSQKVDCLAKAVRPKNIEFRHNIQNSGEDILRDHLGKLWDDKY